MKRSFKGFWKAVNTPQKKEPPGWFEILSIIFMVVTTILSFLRMLGVFDSPEIDPLPADIFLNQ